jgi:arginyl-tRNA synthetase
LAKFGNGQTPESTGLKEISWLVTFMWHLIRLTKEEIAQLMSTGKTEEEAKNKLQLF